MTTMREVEQLTPEVNHQWKYLKHSPDCVVAALTTLGVH